MNFKTTTLCFLLPLILFLLTRCADDQKSSKNQNPLSNFSNILNYKGLPSSIDDKSVFMYSDKGAWHGFSLPNDLDSNYLGSFIGPYLMTQDNGVWLSKCLSQFNLYDKAKNQFIDMSNARLIMNESYLHSLKQKFELPKDSLLIISELFFISDRSNIVKMSIQNQGSSAMTLQIQWKGESILPGAKFSIIDNEIAISFAKNENVGLISYSDNVQFKTQIFDTAYMATSNEIQIAPQENFTTSLSQSFYFSASEKENYNHEIQRALALPDEFQDELTNEWQNKLDDVLAQLNPKFDSLAYQRIAIKCMETLRNNWRSPAGFLKHAGLFPSYNYKWFNGFWAWDSWKHATALALYDITLAKDQIRAMFDFQDEFGMIADCVYRDTIIENHNWRDTKPPLSAWAIWEIYEREQDLDFLNEMIPKLEKYHNWWYVYRDFDNNGICEYGSTDGSLIAAKWESGMDNAVRFDEATMLTIGKGAGSLNQESVDLNAFLFAEKMYLHQIAKVLDQDKKSEKYLDDAQELKSNIQSLFYNTESKWFFDISLDDKVHIPIFGPEAFIPLWSSVATKSQAHAMKEVMLDKSKFNTYIPFPTLSADHPKFKPDQGYWRGPIWLDQVYFALEGMRNYGFKNEADSLTLHVFNRLEGLKNDNKPIRENYHPLNGKGMESNHFSWSAAHLLLLLTEGQ